MKIDTFVFSLLFFSLLFFGKLISHLTFGLVHHLKWLSNDQDVCPWLATHHIQL